MDYWRQGPYHWEECVALYTLCKIVWINSGSLPVTLNLYSPTKWQIHSPSQPSHHSMKACRNEYHFQN